MPAEEESGAAMEGDDSPQQFCLRWNNYLSNLAASFDQLLQTEAFVDVTLACEGQSLKAHKVVLSACSPYFQTLLMDNPCGHPVIIMRDIKYCDLKAVVDFVYRGEINVSQDQISALLKVAETLKIRGLTDVSGEQTVFRAEVPPSAPKRSSSSGSGGTRKARRRSAAASATASVESSPGPSPQRSPNAGTAVHSPPPSTQPATSHAPPPTQMHHDDIDIRPGIAEMIREEERAKLIENSHAWLGASTSSIADNTGQNLKFKSPVWSQAQLREAIQAVVTQRMRFTQAAAHYGIPKGTLYDNILGKSKRMSVLDDTMLTADEEKAILNFCCQTNLSPYNRRTKRSLAEVLHFLEQMKRRTDPGFSFTGLDGFRWWWAFCKKHSIVSLCYNSCKKAATVKPDSYQYQLQSMWQKCWNTNQSMVHNLRFRERGPLKSWRPETMAEAIFSVLKEGLSLSQAARKYDIPYPTFVLYANRVHNMLGPSSDGGADLRPKGRGRPQRILLGVWPDEHIRGVIRAVVFRDSHAAHAPHAPHAPHTPHTPHAPHAPHNSHIKEEAIPVYHSMSDGLGVQNAYNVSGSSVVCGNGRDDSVSPNAAAAAAVAAVAHGLRRQMCNMVAAAQRPPDHPHAHLGLSTSAAAAAAAAAAAGLQMPLSQSPRSAGGSVGSPLHSTTPPNQGLELPKQQDPFRPFVSPRPDSRYQEQTLRDQLLDAHDMGPPRAPMPKNDKDQMLIPSSMAGPSSGLPGSIKLESPSSENRGESI